MVLDDIAATRPGRADPDATSGATGRGELRRRAVALVDRTVAAVVDTVGSDPGTVIAVIGVTAPTAAPALSPIVITGPGVEPGVVTSPGTGRPGLATLIDVAPTVLQSLGVAPRRR